MDNSRNYITPAGVEKLKAEYAELFHNERPKLVEIISWAASNGDRSENADYIYGKRRLREIDKRLFFLTTMVSPFVGRLDDIGQDGMDLVADIIQIYDSYDFTTDVLVASIRSPLHLQSAALMGADIATIPYKVMQQLTHHHLTDKGIKIFMDDWAKANKA